MRNERGYVLLSALVFAAILLMTGSGMFAYTAEYARYERLNVASAQARSLSEAGIDKAIAELNKDALYAGETTLLGAGSFTVAVETLSQGGVRITSTGSVESGGKIVARIARVEASKDTSYVAFHYGVQVGEGGVEMQNGSRIEGNLYSNGEVSGSGTVTGDATVGGAAGSIDGITVGGNARAHVLSDCSVGGDAYYQTLSLCAVSGASHPGSDDPATSTFPISDAKLADWESEAEAGGVIAGSHAIANNKSETLGPKKITGDLQVSGTLSLSGPVWVVGSVSFGNNSALRVDSSGQNGAVLIADDPGNPGGGGPISLSNNMVIAGNGSPDSHPLLITTNDSGSAISLNNNAESAILYAPRGTISLSNNASADQITAWRLHLNNNATVYYVDGLQSSSFSGGPGGGWTVVPGSYVLLP